MKTRSNILLAFEKLIVKKLKIDLHARLTGAQRSFSAAYPGNFFCFLNSLKLFAFITSFFSSLVFVSNNMFGMSPCAVSVSLSLSLLGRPLSLPLFPPLKRMLFGGLAAFGRRFESGTWAPFGLQRIEATAACTHLGLILSLSAPRATLTSSTEIKNVVGFVSCSANKIRK